MVDVTDFRMPCRCIGQAVNGHYRWLRVVMAFTASAVYGVTDTRRPCWYA